MGNGHSSLSDEGYCSYKGQFEGGNSSIQGPHPNRLRPEEISRIEDNTPLSLAQRKRFPQAEVNNETQLNSENGTKASELNNEVPTLDFNNMPFLRPSGESGSGATNSFYPSPSLSSYLPSSPGSVDTEWIHGHSKQPTYHRVTHSTEVCKGIVADIKTASELSPLPQDLPYSHSSEMSPELAEYSPQSTNTSPVFSETSFPANLNEESPATESSLADSSVSSQLSLLSQKSGSSSPRSHRYSFHSPQHSEIEIDASVPPAVPPHYVVPSHARQSSDALKESALAAVEALESAAEEDSNVSRNRPRSTSASSRQSLTRSLSRPFTRTHSRAHSIDSIIENKTPSTDVYTRKCPILESPGLIRTDDTDDESCGPDTPDRGSFALKGYNEGHTVLRVVNSESDDSDDNEEDEREKPKGTSLIEKRPSKKIFVKSKAQLALEEEQRQRRRYARYGQPFRSQPSTQSTL